MADFEEVYRLYFRDVYKYALSLSKNAAAAEEITQETFFRALNKIDDFNGECKLYVWLCQIAKNVFLSLCEKEKRLEYGAETGELCGTKGLEQNFLLQESAGEIHKALHALQEPYKEVFSLRLLGGLPFAQIAELFEKTESWARVTYYRAKLKIRESLEDKQEGSL